MKKLFAIILVVMMMPLFGIAEEKYAGRSLSELQAEYTAILKAMWKSNEWQEVRVPAGVYKIGDEIPAGEWTVKNSDYFVINVGSVLNATKTEIEGSSDWYGEVIEVNEYPNGLTLTLPEGLYVYFNYAVIFTSPVKGAGFTFK